MSGTFTDTSTNNSAGTSAGTSILVDQEKKSAMAFITKMVRGSKQKCYTCELWMVADNEFHDPCQEEGRDGSSNYTSDNGLVHCQFTRQVQETARLLFMRKMQFSKMSCSNCRTMMEIFTRSA